MRRIIGRDEIIGVGIFRPRAPAEFNNDAKTNNRRLKKNNFDFEPMKTEIDIYSVFADLLP